MSLNLGNPGRTLHAGVILMGTTEILDVAPIDFLYGMTHPFVKYLPIPDELKAQGPDIAFHWITEHGEPAKMTGNVVIQATDSSTTSPPLDIVLIGASTPPFTPTPADLAFIRKAYAESSAFLTICAGVLPAVLAGVLKNTTVTGPREFIPMLKGLDPSVAWVEKRWCKDGKVWTSGALLNGLDMMREFSGEHWGKLASVCGSVGGMVDRKAAY